MRPTGTNLAIVTISAFVIGAAMVAVPGCGSSAPGLSTDAAAGTSGGGSTGAGDTTGVGGTTGTGGTGNKITVGQTQCSDGIDNHGDCKIDYADPECIGPLDNGESSFATG